MPEHETITVTLPSDMAAELRALVAARRYASPSQAIEEALADWRDKHRLRDQRRESIRARIRESLDDPRPSLSEAEVARRIADHAAAKPPRG
jgi:antitoxin ParD1/3/4